MKRGSILSAMGGAIANAGGTIGSMMMRGAEDDERRADRERERDEQRQFQAEQNAMYRKPADAAAAGRSGSGGPSGMPLADLESGKLGGGLVGRSLGLTDPELAMYDEAAETGNFDKFKTGKKPGEYGAAGPEQMSPEEFNAARAAYPPGVSDDAIRAKIKMIAEMRASLVMGKDNESYQDGERSRQKRNATDDAMKNPAQAGRIGAAMAAGDGDGAYGKGNVNQFTGAPDQVGQSVIRENNAQAGKAATDAKTGTAGVKNETLKALTQERIAVTNAAEAATRELAALRGMSAKIPLSEREAHKAEVTAAKAKAERYERERDDLNGRIRAFASGGAAPAVKAPAKPAAMPAAGVTKGGSKYTIVKK